MGLTAWVSGIGSELARRMDAFILENARPLEDYFFVILRKF